MKKDQANKTNVERVYRWQPLAWEPGLNGSSIDLRLVWEWAQHSCTSCASTHWSWSGAEAEEAEWRQMGLEVARGGQRRGREVIPWQEETLEGIISSKQGKLGEYEKKRKRRESENVLYFGEGGLKGSSSLNSWRMQGEMWRSYLPELKAVKKACLSLMTAYHLFRRS